MVGVANKGGRRPFGSVRKRPSGRYQVRYVVDGTTYSAPMTYATKADAQAFLATIQTDLVRVTWQAPRLVTEPVAEYVGRWIYEHSGLKATTRELYESKLRNNIAGTTLGKTPLCDLTPDVVRTWYAHMRTELAQRAEARRGALVKKGREPSAASTANGSVSAAQTYRLLRAAMTTATQDGLIPRNPCLIKGASSSTAAERPTATPSRSASGSIH